MKLEHGSWTQLLAAIATFIAVWFALFKERILARRYAPDLRVTANQEAPDIDHIPMGYAMPGTGHYPNPIVKVVDCYFLRLWIENKGKTRAEKVQVFVKEVISVKDKHAFPLKSFIPMNLRWSFGSERPTHAEVFADGISPDMGVHCNFARVLDPDKRKEVGDDHDDAKPGETVLRLTTEMDPNNRCNVLAPGMYHVKLLIARANCKPKAVIVEINLTGHWFAETGKMLQKGVLMKIIE